MKKLPFAIGTIHFVGIGGIGMSGLARILKAMGYDVQGSDVKGSANIELLENMGIKVIIGHKSENVDQAKVVVVSSAIPQSNVEVVAARQKRLPVLQRADMLGEIMRLRWSIGVAGTHGKTTTTSLIGALLESLEPTVINGGIINAYGSNTRLGSGDWLVAETDESDGTFTQLPCTIGIVTNIDPEHLDHYASEQEMIKAYERFVHNIPFYGLAIMCSDHPVVSSLISSFADKKIISYGFNSQADVQAFNRRYEPQGVFFDVRFSSSLDGENQSEIVWKNLFLPMMGDHNILNALASLAVAFHLGVKQTEVRLGLSNFKGVNRRFTYLDEINGMRLFDDYAHHPVEIRATLKAARQANLGGKIMAVMQPHRYSRLKSLYNDFCCCFDEADHVIIMPIYAAGEEPIKDITHHYLEQGVAKTGHKSVMCLENYDGLPDILTQKLTSGDMVLFLGAGDISMQAHHIVQKMKSQTQQLQSV